MTLYDQPNGAEIILMYHALSVVNQTSSYTLSLISVNRVLVATLCRAPAAPDEPIVAITGLEPAVVTHPLTRRIVAVLMGVIDALYSVFPGTIILKTCPINTPVVISKLIFALVKFTNCMYDLLFPLAKV